MLGCSCCCSDLISLSTVFVAKLSLERLAHCRRQIHRLRNVHLLVAAPLCGVGKVAPSPWALLLPLLLLLLRLGH